MNIFTSFLATIYCVSASRGKPKSRKPIVPRVAKSTRSNDEWTAAGEKLDRYLAKLNENSPATIKAHELERAMRDRTIQTNSSNKFGIIKT